MQIVSASRRTDIPAFYGKWFMERLREGGTVVRHPFTGEQSYLSLLREDVAAFVFWSKDYRNFIQELAELEDRSYPFVLHYTITGLPKYLEGKVLPAEESVEVFRYLSLCYTPERVLWRYDPVFLSGSTDYNFHVRNFSHLCRCLEGYTRRCYISFVHPYRKVEKRLQKTGLQMLRVDNAYRRNLAESLAEIAEEHGITVYACCSNYLLGGKVQKARCIDAELLHQLFGIDKNSFRRRPSRPSCGCSASIDLGHYGTCGHRCVYCYARR